MSRDTLSDEEVWELEASIETQRLERNWSALKKSLETYAQIFDRSIDRSTKLHTSLREMKSFYWCCTAEMSLHSSLDFNAAMDAIRRAIAFNNQNIQVRILIVHFLLCVCQESISLLYPRDRKIVGGTVTASNKLTNFGADHEITLASIIGDQYQGFTEELQVSLEEVMQALYSNERDAILSILASSHVDDVVNICRSFQLRDAMTNKQPENLPFRKLQFILIIAKYFLSSISLDNAAQAFQQRAISSYYYWLCIDAVYTRSIVHEMLQQFVESRNDLIHIIGHISANEVGSMPGSCGCQVLLAACKLPLLECKFPSRWLRESMISFQQITSDQAVYCHYLPASMLMSMTVMSTLSKLDNAMAMFREARGHDHDEEFAGSIFDFLPVSGVDPAAQRYQLPSSIQQEVYSAYSILQSFYLQQQSDTEMMAELMATNRPYLQPFNPLLPSMTYYLPEDVYNIYAGSVDRSQNDFFAKASSFACITTNPLLLSYQVSKGIVGLLLAGITSFVYHYYHIILKVQDPTTATSANPQHRRASLTFDYSSHITDDSDETSLNIQDELYTLTYSAYHMEIQPSLYTLYNFAMANLSIGKIAEALSLWKQCQHQLLLLKKLEERKISNGQDIVSAQFIPLSLHAFDRTLVSILPCLGMKAQPLLHPYLPACLYNEAVLRLNLEETYLSEGLNLLKESILQFYTKSSDQRGIGWDVLQLLDVQYKDEGDLILEEGLGTRYHVHLDQIQREVSSSVALSTLKSIAIRSTTSYIANGMVLLLLQYAKAHWAYARQLEVISHNHSRANGGVKLKTHLSNAERHQHQVVALRTVMFLYTLTQDLFEGDSMTVYVMIAGEVLSEIVLYYSMIVAEVGGVQGLTVAIDQLKLWLSSKEKLAVQHSTSAIHNMQQVIQEHERTSKQWKLHIYPKLLHLLTLCMTSKDLDNPEVYAVSIAFLQAYIRQLHRKIDVSVPNSTDSGRLTNAIPDGIHSDGKTAASPEDRTDVNYINVQCWNLRYSILLMLFNSGEYHQVFIYSEELIKDIRSFMHYQFQCHGKTLQPADDNAASAVGSSVSTTPAYSDIFPCYYNYINAYQTSIVPIPFACQILVNVSKLCGKLGKIDLCKKACSVAWRLLYHIDEDLMERLEHIGSEDHVGNVDHDAIDALKTIPTLLGWRIAEGYGVHDKHFYQIESDVYCECAAILARSHTQPPLKKLEEIYQLSLATFPQHCQSLTHLASIYHERYQQSQMQEHRDNILSGQPSSSPIQQTLNFSSIPTESTKVASINSDLSMAFFYIQGALKANDRSPEAWQLLSMIANELEMPDIAVEALITSDECRAHLPIRPLASVLW